jgi:hypothetical protein
MLGFRERSQDVNRHVLNGVRCLEQLKEACDRSLILFFAQVVHCLTLSITAAANRGQKKR